MHSEDKSQKITFPLFFCCNSILSHQVNKNVILSLKINGLLQKHFYLKKYLSHLTYFNHIWTGCLNWESLKTLILTCRKLARKKLSFHTSEMPLMLHFLRDQFQGFHIKAYGLDHSVSLHTPVISSHILAGWLE